MSKKNDKTEEKEIIVYFLAVFIISTLGFLVVGIFYLLGMLVVDSWYYVIDIYYPEPLPFSCSEVMWFQSICLFIGLGYLFFVKQIPRSFQDKKIYSILSYDDSRIVNFFITYILIWPFLLIITVVFIEIKNDYEMSLKEKTQITSSIDCEYQYMLVGSIYQ